MIKYWFLLLALFSALAHAAPADVVDFLVYHEQNFMVLNGGDPERLSPDTNLQSLRFRPGPRKTFLVKSYWIDADQINGYVGRNIAQYPSVFDQMIKTENGRSYYRLLVHPESEVFYRDFLASAGAVRAEDYRAVPTASSRTLLVYPPGRKDLAFFAKLSLNRMIGEVRRTIKASEIALSIGVNNTLYDDEPTMPEGFNAFPEVLGLMPPGMERGGMLIRAIPPKILNGKTRYMPLFSIYAAKAGRNRTLLEDMIAKTGQAPDEFVRERIIRPFLVQWLDLAVNHGITMEAHGQNLVIGIGADGLPDGNFAYRDFGGFNIDFDYRDQIGLPRPVLPVAEGSTFAKTYCSRDHLSNMRASINDYFSAGAIYDIDILFASAWREAGFKEDHLREAVRSELNDLMQAQDPELPKLYKNFVNLASNIQILRSAVSGVRVCEGRLKRRKGLRSR